MPAAQMEPSFDQWINICQNLSEFENFALIGYLSISYRPPLGVLATADLINEQNTRAAEKWADSNFRKMMQFLCRNQQKVETTETVIDKAEAAKTLAPLVVATFSFQIGVAVAAIFAIYTKKLGTWCDKYKERKYSGKGFYRGGFPEKEVQSFFELSYTPPIEEFYEDPEAYPLKVNKIRVKVEAESTGKIKLPSETVADSIYKNQGRSAHTFTFFDVTVTRDIFGVVEFIRTSNEKNEKNILYFGADGVQISPSTKTVA